MLSICNKKIIFFNFFGEKADKGIYETLLHIVLTNGYQYGKILCDSEKQRSKCRAALLLRREKIKEKGEIVLC